MSQLYDRQVALEQAGGDADLLAELIDVFADEGPTLLRQLRAAIAAGDAGEVQRIAHTLKGTARVFGAEPAAEAAQRLEAMGRENDLAEAESALATLQTEIDRLIEALSAETSGSS